MKVVVGVFTLFGPMLLHSTMSTTSCSAKTEERHVDRKTDRQT